ncbi:MAG: GNAT family N-acetyltransferase [Pseudomonadota bacterium]
MGLFEDVLERAIGPQTTTKGERRKAPRPATLRASQSGITSTRWELELLPAMALERLGDDITSLYDRALEPHPFFCAPVVKAAWPRLNSLLAPLGCWMLCLWETPPGEGKDARHLRLFMPVRLQKLGRTALGLPGALVLQSLGNEYMPVATPLLDGENAGESCETLLRLLGDPALTMPALLHLNEQYGTGETLAQLRAAASRLGLPHKITHGYERAALHPLKDGADPQAAAKAMPANAKRRRELARQFRKLEQQGPLHFSVVRETDALLDAFESFITLELRSWKGRGGSALYNHKKIAAFSRQIVTELALEGTCEIHMLSQGDGPLPRMVAGLIMLGENGNMMPWKMAYDEVHAAASPGMQMMVRASRALLASPHFIHADSLAKPDHWMMNHLWPDRVRMEHIAIGLNTRAGAEVTRAVRQHGREMKLRKIAKRLLRR